MFNIEALFNAKEGLSKEDVKLPSIWVQNIKKPIIEPIPKKDNYLHDWFNRHLNEDDLHHIFNEYLRKGGWDKEKGTPTVRIPEDLDFDDL